MRKIFLTGLLMLLLAIPLVSAQLCTNLYSHWTLNASSGTNVYDSSGNNRNGTTVNNPSWVAGLLNNSLQLNGIDQFVNFTNSSIGDFERNGSFSIEFWLNSSALDYQKEIVNKRSADGEGKGYEIILSTDNSVFVMIGNATDMILVYSDAKNFTDMKWHHLVVTYDGSSLASGVFIYIDGTKSQNTIFDSISESISNTGNLQFGMEYDNFFAGQLDEVVFYTKVLNQTEVNFRYNNGTGTEKIYDCQAPAPPTTTTTSTTTTTVPINVTTTTTTTTTLPVNVTTTTAISLPPSNTTYSRCLDDITLSKNTYSSISGNVVATNENFTCTFGCDLDLQECKQAPYKNAIYIFAGIICFIVMILLILRVVGVI